MSQAFIGCKISLISKSEIRYEGILYTIDTKESTIALSKVRSFGTEDRKTDKPVAPRNEVYEYIIFRASDIKDLIVDDPPAAASTGLSDPAIIQAQSVGTSITQASTTYTVLPGTSISTTTSAGATKQPTLANVLNAGNQAKPAQSTARSASRGSSPNVQRKSPANEQKQQERRSNQPRSDQGRSDGRSAFNNRGGRDGGRRENQGNQQQNQQPPQQRQMQQQPHQQQQQRPYQNRQFPNQQQQQYGHQNREYNSGGQRGGGRGGYRDALQNAPRPGQGGYRNNQGQQGYNRPRPQSFNQNRPPRTDVTKLEDYDFEKANQEFTELESKFEKLDVAPESKPDEPEAADTSNSKQDEEDDAFYDKKKSFFDSISCEALERSKGNVQRIDRTQERKLNQETFGVAGIRGRGGYRRGYGRGGYHNNRNTYQRGGYNNRGGGNRSYNNNRNDGEGNQEPRQSQPASQQW